LFLDSVALTWYLWRWPGESLTQLDRTLSTIGGWVAAVCAFFGIRSKVRKQPDWPVVFSQLPVVLIALLVTILVWFFVLPFHSLEIMVRNSEGPLELATATFSPDASPIRGQTGRDGLLKVPALMAASYTVRLAREGYHSRTVGFPFSGSSAAQGRRPQCYPGKEACRLGSALQRASGKPAGGRGDLSGGRALWCDAGPTQPASG
jgi:hypothetical protein